MQQGPISTTNVTDILGLVRDITDDYANMQLALVNNHVVRLSVMTGPYHWHYHPNSDETFIVIEGVLVIELETSCLELTANQVFTIARNTIHRTRPQGGRSVNLTVELLQIQTVEVNR